MSVNFDTLYDKACLGLFDGELRSWAQNKRIGFLVLHVNAQNMNKDRAWATLAVMAQSHERMHC